MPSQEFGYQEPSNESVSSIHPMRDPYNPLTDPGPHGDGTPETVEAITGVVSPPSSPPGVYLDPKWAVERAMISMVAVSRRKRADYATDGDEFSNFRGTAEFAGFESPAMSALFNVAQKLERIRALRANGRFAEVANESVDDTFLDIAVYAVLAHAMWIEDQAGSAG